MKKYRPSICGHESPRVHYYSIETSVYIHRDILFVSYQRGRSQQIFELDTGLIPKTTLLELQLEDEEDGAPVDKTTYGDQSFDYDGFIWIRQWDFIFKLDQKMNVLASHRFEGLTSELYCKFLNGFLWAVSKKKILKFSLDCFD